MNNVTFSDKLAYRPPEQPNCLVVPEVQWDELDTNLGKASVGRDVVLWCVAGICGGGAVSCLVTFFAYPDIKDASTVQLAKEYAFLIIGLLLGVATVVVVIVAWKLGSASTAGQVRGQMKVLKPGFRRLMSEQTTSEQETDPEIQTPSYASSSGRT